MAEKTELKGGDVRDENSASRAKPRPANKGRHAREDPLVDRQEEEGRAARTAPKRAGFVLGAILSIAAAGALISCDDNKSKNDADAGTDAGSECTVCPDTDTDNDSRLVSELCGQLGSKPADNEAVLSVGGKAVLTKSGHSVVGVEIDPGTGIAVLRFLMPDGQQMENEHYGYAEVSAEDPILKINADGEEQKIAFCGFESSEGGPAARIATNRKTGVVHCEGVNSDSNSVPVEHQVDNDTTQVLVSSVHSGGEVASDGDVEDCDPQTNSITKQVISFEDSEGNPAGLCSRNLLLFSEMQKLRVHKLVDGELRAFEVDLYEVDAGAGTAKVGTSKLGVGTLGLGKSFVANGGLRVTLNGFDGETPALSYAYEPDADAQVWRNTTENPNGVEVNVVSGDTTKIYVVRFSGNKGDGNVDVTVLKNSALSVLGSGSEANFEGKLYTSAVEADGTAVTKITLTPFEW